MDTVKKAIWGDNEQNTQEPVSGQQGDTSKGEPYDAGNKEPANDPSSNTSGGNSNPSGDAPQDSEVKDSSMAGGDSTSDQNDTRDPSDPNTKPSTEGAKSNVDNSSSDGPDLSGPGPRPVAKLAAEHGGDAGNLDGEKQAGGDGEGKDAEGDDEDDDGPQKTSHGEGTGEKYVKSSGLKADGGDFDAANPGAGKEADRLLEEKGMHNPTETADAPAPDAEQKGDNDGPEIQKKSLGQKIKEKVSSHKSG